MRNLNFKLKLKCIIYQIAKYLGFFKLALKKTEKDYRVLCYHGGSINDEHLFWPGVFITEKVFKKHLQLIQKYQFTVLPLDELIKKISQNILPKRCLVLTFDDGFYSTKLLEPILKKINYPATLYVTTYYVTHQRIIFNVALSYLFYKSKEKSITLTLFDGKKLIFNTKDKQSQQAIEEINKYAKTLDENEQNHLIKKLSKELEVNIEPLLDQRIFYNLNPEELKEIHNNNIFDIQLHTHRHDLPNNKNTQTYEIQKNRKVISEITGKNERALVHFCYPSGLWSEKYFPWLRELGIQSAVTLDPGLNKMHQNSLALKRILCTNSKPLIIFEAEISGFNSMLTQWIKNCFFFKKQ